MVAGGAHVLGVVCVLKLGTRGLRGRGSPGSDAEGGRCQTNVVVLQLLSTFPSPPPPARACLLASRISTIPRYLSVRLQRPPLSSLALAGCLPDNLNATGFLLSAGLHLANY